MWTDSAKGRAIAQTKANILAVIEYYGLPAISILTTQIDRVTALVPYGFSQQLMEAGFRHWPYARNHGTTAVRSWREGCPLYSMQAVEHDSGNWEFDIDLVNPFPAKGTALSLGYACESLWNRLRHGRTDPYRIQAGLRRRGIEI